MCAMSTSALQADAFYEEVLREGAVWTIRDAGGYPSPNAADGGRAMPFWSLQTRAELLKRAPTPASSSKAFR